MITLYEFKPSGNCHKIRMLLAMLGLKYTSVVFEGNKQDHKSLKFLQMNPFGQVPVLTDDAVVLRDSQAILYYLAETYAKGTWWPSDMSAAAKVVGWLSVAANEVARGPMALRVHYKFGRVIDVPAATAMTTELFQILEAHLAEHSWMVGTSPTIADIALYPYIALAPEARWDLTPYTNIRAWLGRIRKLPNYIGMPEMYVDS